MRFASIVGLSVVGAAVIASPAPIRRALSGGVTYCTDVQFQGDCLSVSSFNATQCVGIGRGFNDRISSFRPDTGIKCIIWSDFNCQGNGYAYVTNPGIADLRDRGFNDIISSFECKAV
ncbi:hypothetical protein BDV93DRAFT_560864 [Ceratobasidium sp. AG-I]|nr:hypothetical protein BDV93DRAFT_560864 [Ceratobasidium sp. AG-I]